MKHRVLSIVFAIGLLFSIAPWAAAMGSEIVEISDSAELAAIAEDLNGHYKLMCDIKLTEAWTPITTLAEGEYPAFTGILDGDGHAIQNLYMDEQVESASLIGDMDEGAVIQNLRVELGGQGASSASDASGLVSYMFGGRIENCSVSGNVINTNPEDCWAGALVAYMVDGTVSGCRSTGSVSGGGAGGLIGCIEGGTVENCYSLADVAGTFTADDFSISDVGGLVGSADGAAISNCYAAGTVSAAKEPGSLGGFLGVRGENCSLTSCFYELDGVLDGVGTDHSFQDEGEPEGKDGRFMTSGAPLAADWNTEVWYFSTSEYPKLQWEREQTEEPLAPPAVSEITFGEPQGIASQYIQFPAVSGAVAYRINIYGLPAAERSDPVLLSAGGAEPLYTGLFTPLSPLSDPAQIPLTDMLTEAAKADIDLNPQKSAFSYSVSVAALGSGSIVGAFSDQFVLPVMQRLTGVEAPNPIVCERGDPLTKPAKLSGTVDGVKVNLPIQWSFPYTMPDTADFVGKRTYEAALILPIRVLNPDSYMAKQVVEAYGTHKPPQSLAWDSAKPGKATWVLPDEPGGAVIVCLLDKNQNPVSGEKIVPRQTEQNYDFSESMQKLGTGDYYFRIKTKASADGYFRESEWTAVSEAYHYTAPSGGGSTTTYYTLLATAGVGGNISPSGRIRIVHSGSQTFTIDPNAGYTVADVLVDGESVGAVGCYIFEKVTNHHTIEAYFQKETGRPAWNPFQDVREGDWFYDSVRLVYENNMMLGTSANLFSPYWNTSRGMIVTILWRLEEEPGSDARMTFDDVKASAYSFNAIRWAAEHKIVKGYDAETFGPDNAISRQELAAILYRYAQYKGRDVNASDDLAAFIDRPSLWAEENVKWAVGTGILVGKGGGILDPRGHATRAETAAMFARYLQTTR